MAVYRNSAILGRPDQTPLFLEQLNNAVEDAEASATAAAASVSQAQSVLDEFNGTYYGPLTSDPTEDPNGAALTEGDLYFNTTSNVLRLYDGSSWTDVATGSTVLLKTNNLSDLSDVATARTNLGLDTAAQSAATDFLAVANNLSDLNNAATARTNLGLGTIAVDDATEYVAYTGLTAELPCADNIVSRPEIKDYAETVSTPSSTAGAITVDLTEGNVAEITLTENTTFTFSNPPATGKSGSLTIILKQDSTGSWTTTWPASVTWAGGTAPTLTTTASAIDILTFLTTDGGTTWYGFLSGGGMS